MDWLRDAINEVLLRASDVVHAGATRLVEPWPPALQGSVVLLLAVVVLLFVAAARRASRLRIQLALFGRVNERLRTSDTAVDRSDKLFHTVFESLNVVAGALYLGPAGGGPLLLQTKRVNSARGVDDGPDGVPVAPGTERAPSPAPKAAWEPETRLDHVPSRPRIVHRGLPVVSIPCPVDGSRLAVVQLATARESDARAILRQVGFVQSLLTPLVSQLALDEQVRQLREASVAASIVSGASQTILNTTLDLEELGRLLLDLSLSTTESDAGVVLLGHGKPEARERSVLAATGIEPAHVQQLLSELDWPPPHSRDEHWILDAKGDSVAHGRLKSLGFQSLLHVWVGPPPERPGELLLVKRLGSFQDGHVQVSRLNASRLALSLRNKAYHEAVFDEYKAMLTGMIATHESVGHLKGHSDRVAGLAAELATIMGVDAKEVEGIRLAGKLHDLGMVSLGADILFKPARLTPQEYDLVKHHPAIGAALTMPIRLPVPIAPLILHHHERHDGQGYPDGLKGDEIPFGARVLALAEVFDAMLTSRSYREALSLEQARRRIRDMAGTQLHPDVVGAFLRAITDERWRAIASSEVVATPPPG